MSCINSKDPNQILRLEASDLGLHGLTMPLLWYTNHE